MLMLISLEYNLTDSLLTILRQVQERTASIEDYPYLIKDGKVFLFTLLPDSTIKWSHCDKPCYQFRCFYMFMMMMCLDPDNWDGI